MDSSSAQSFSEPADFIWSVADVLLGDYRQSGFGALILLRGREFNDESYAICIADMLTKELET